MAIGSLQASFNNMGIPTTKVNNQYRSTVFKASEKGPPEGGRRPAWCGGGAGAGVVRSPQKPKRLTDERNKQTPFGWKTPLIFNV